MKKALSLLLTLSLCGSLAACTASPESTPVATDPPTGTASPAPAPEKPSRPSGTLAPFSKTATIEETVLVDENDVKIIATGLTYGSNAAELELTIENNSAQDLSFISGSIGYSCNSVNGIMVSDGYLNCDVAAGKKAMDKVRLDYSNLQLYGIQEITEIELGFYTTDEDYDSCYFPLHTIMTSAYGQSDVIPSSYQETICSSEAQNTFDYTLLGFAADRLYDQNGVSVLSEALIENEDGERSVLIEVENKAEDTRMISAGNILVNDLLIYTGQWCTDAVAPGKRAVISIDLSSLTDARSWDLYGIGTIGSFSAELQQKDSDWNAITDPEQITVSFADADPIDTAGEELYNQNGLRIVSKTVLAPSDEWDSQFRFMLLAENTGSSAAELELPYNVMSVNGFMVDQPGESWLLQPGQCAMMEIELYDSDLEEINITELSQITEAEFDLEINQNGNTLDTAAIKMSLS